MHAQAVPLPPCSGSQTRTEPPRGALGGPPNVAVWNDIEIGFPEPCPGSVAGRFELVVSLAGRFAYPGSIDDMAARFGAISTTKGLRYWSVTDGRWLPLIADAFAVQSPSERVRRPDFAASEVLSGETLFFTQDDTRSSGYNVYAMKAVRVSADTLVIETYNVTGLRLFVIPLFAPGSLRTFHYLYRGPSGEWSYYGLSLARAGMARGYERSFINRAAAYYRFLAGRPSDGAPPLAP